MEKLLRAARISEAIALRTYRKVRNLFFIGVLSCIWLAYYFMYSFELSLRQTALIFLLIVLPPLLIGKLCLVLQEIIGLPDRLLEMIRKVKNQTVSFQQKIPDQKPKLSQLWRLGQVLLEVKSLGDEAREILSLFSAVLILSNPIFAVVTGLAGATTFLLLLLALVTGLLYLV